MALIEEYAALHKSGDYGLSSIKRLPFILAYIKQSNAQCIIDYGCGRSILADTLARATGAKVFRYDPAIPEYATHPAQPFDLLVSIDVLEHIPEDSLDAVLADMRRLADKAIISIDTKPAVTILSDGRNAHVTLQSADWWRRRLAQFYPVVERLPVRRRPASFRTWHVGPAVLLKLRAETATYRLRDRWTKIKKRGRLFA